MQFVDVVVRQAHPGPTAETYGSIDDKLADAERYAVQDGIGWPVLADDLQGTVHQVYGGLADPTYLIDADGNVSYYVMWTYAPSLHQGIEALFAQGGRGVVLEGINRRPHMLPALTTGWLGLERGLPQSVVDMETATPGTALMVWVGYQVRGVLAPFTQRAEPLPASVKLGLTAAALGLGFLGWRQLVREK